MTPLHFKKFNEKVQAMNQSGGKELKMTATEARSLHGAIFTMLEEMSRMNEGDSEELVINLDAGEDSL